MASGWLWLNLALALIPTALICLASLACERISCSPGTGNPGRCDRPGDRIVIVSKRMRATQLAKVGRGPDSAVSPGALLRVHFPRGVPFAREGRTRFLRVASLIAPQSILCGPRVMGMGV